MLNEKIKSLRLSFNMTQVELAAKLGVSKQCVSNWENDNILPSVEMLVKISQFFNVSCDNLLGVESKRVVSVDGLSDEQIAHVKLIISDLRNNK